MGIIIDSSVFIEAERRGRDLVDIVALVPDDETLMVAAITVAELLVGVHLGEPQLRRDIRSSFIEGILRRFPVLDFDQNVARVYAESWANLRRAGNSIPPHDLQIGATALYFGYDVLTDNLRHFSRIPRLRVREPGW